MNSVAGRAEASASGVTFVHPDLARLPLPSAPEAAGDVTLGVRPEDLYVSGMAPASKNVAPFGTFTLDVLEPMGNEIVLYASSGDTSVVARVEPQPMPQPGEPITLSADLDKLHTFDTASGVSLRHAVEVA